MAQIDLGEIIRFYDEKNPNDREQVSSITGLIGEDLGAGLVKHYLESTGSKVNILKGSPSEYKDSEKNKAKKLDRWIKEVKNDQVTFFQTEIKNWSSHSIGGYRLGLTCSLDQIINCGNKKFDGQWDGDKLSLKLPYVSKVLKKMNLPPGFEPGNQICPLVCYWYPILPPTIPDPRAFFTMECKDPVFEKICFFSMSSYLRELYRNGITEIDIETPNVSLRLAKVRTLFKNV